jgi:hypothetical protein
MRRPVLRVPSKTTGEACLDERKLAADWPEKGSRQPPKRIVGGRRHFRLEKRRRRGNLGRAEPSIWRIPRLKTLDIASAQTKIARTSESGH